MAAATKTLSEKRRAAANSMHERKRLRMAIADHLAGEPLATKTTDELRDLLAGAAVRR